MISLHVRAVPGRTVFAVDDHGRPLIPVRHVGAGEDGEHVAAQMTADGRVMAKSPLIRSALQSGDLEEVDVEVEVE